MRIRTLLATLVELAALALTGSVALAGGPSQCQLGRFAEIPVTITGLRPLVSAKINGADALFIADSGAFFSTISAAAAAQFRLPVDRSKGLMMSGVKGTTQAYVATVKEFTLVDTPIHNLEFVVGGTDADSGAVGLLGQNFFRLGDVEYDLAHGAIRLFKTTGCSRNTNLAYWIKPGEGYSVMEIEPATLREPHTTGWAELNGVKIHVAFDTGAATSLLSLRAAARAGVKPGQPGVVAAGFSHGLGPESLAIWIATFKTFEVGGEEIKNARLNFADMRLPFDMLLGADFFLSHRVFVASSQNRLFFTYNGGPVFNLQEQPLAAGAPGQAAGVPQSASGTSSSSGAPPVSNGGPSATPAAGSTDAEGYRQQGDVLAARGQLTAAIAALNHACELKPDEPKYFYERAELFLRTHQLQLAKADLEHALLLKPADSDAHIARAQVALMDKDAVAARLHLDAADRSLPKEANVRLQLGELYVEAHSPERGVAQLNEWIAVHENDALLPEALNGRCWARALLGQELNRALADCNRANRMSPKVAAILDSRGLVWWRLGRFDRAVEDYDRALALAPRTAASLYGRGLSRLRLGKRPEGQADIDAAMALQPDLIRDLQHYGIAP
jgi:tetratricopeptide (TPR) repeat protein/predicted aspartyl protease